MTSTIYRTWENRLSGDTMTRSHIGQFCRAIATVADGYPAGGARTNLTPDQAVILAELFRLHTARRDVYRLTPEHNAFGLKWLAENHGKVADRFNLPDDYLSFDQVVESDPFRWVGWVHLSTNGWKPTSVPVYQVRYYRRDGSVGTWHYHWSAWQVGVYG